MNTMLPNRRRQVVTFYSYKGGVGRTMALANVAWRLADKQGQRVLVVDWDLEAPGLHAFWGLTSDEITQSRGVLDFLLDWRDAIRARAPGPPDVRRSILPITRRPHAPRFGQLSLLMAGRLDNNFDARLASFNWRDFYEKDRGAKAVETLREQITRDFDIVLVDSRTGLTDTGGICTIQLPDAVILLTAPNEQSFRGIERVAQGIVAAPSTQRGGRDIPHLWLAPARISIVEEGYLAEEWYRKYEPDFQRGMADGLWQKLHHRAGLRSYEIPFRARWSFGEQLLHDASGVPDKEILAQSYERLAETLRQWQLGLDASDQPILSTTTATVSDLEAAVDEADRRGDIRGMGEGLLTLGRALTRENDYGRARIVLERAAGIFLGREDLNSYADAILALGIVNLRQLQYVEAKKFFEQAQAIAVASGAVVRETEAVGYLSILAAMQTNQT